MTKYTPMLCGTRALSVCHTSSGQCQITPETYRKKNVRNPSRWSLTTLNVVHHPWTDHMFRNYFSLSIYAKYRYVISRMIRSMCWRNDARSIFGNKGRGMSNKIHFWLQVCCSVLYCHTGTEISTENIHMKSKLSNKKKSEILL